MPLNPNRAGLSLTCLGLVGGMPPPLLSSLFVDLSQRNFAQQIDNRSISSNMEKNYKNNDVIDNDVIIVKNFAEKTVKSVYFKIDFASSFFIQSY